MPELRSGFGYAERFATPSSRCSCGASPRTPKTAPAVLPSTAGLSLGTRNELTASRTRTLRSKWCAVVRRHASRDCLNRRRCTAGVESDREGGPFRPDSPAVFTREQIRKVTVIMRTRIVRLAALGIGLGAVSTACSSSTPNENGGSSANAIGFGESSHCSAASLAKYDVPVDPSVDPAALRALLETVPAGTAWSALPAATQHQLEHHADAVYQFFEERWGDEAVLAKSRVLLQCPTDAMTSAFNTLVPLLYPEAQLPSTFVATTDITTPQLVNTLKKLHVLYYTAVRENAVLRDKNPPQDWDGSSFAGKMDGVRPAIPHQFAFIKAYASSIREELRNLENGGAGTLPPLEAALVQSALYRARSLSTGSLQSRTGYSNGGEDDLVAPAVPWAPNFILSDFNATNGLPDTFSTPEELLEILNAAWLSAPSKWIDVASTGPGIQNMATGFFTPPSGVPAFSGDASIADIVSDYGLMLNWAIQRAQRSRRPRRDVRRTRPTNKLACGTALRRTSCSTTTGPSRYRGVKRRRRPRWRSY